MSPPPFAISTSDRAFLLALRGRTTELSREFWSHLAPSRQVALRSAWEERFRRIEPTEAWETLLAEHRGEALPDPLRIHPTWYVRALRDESPAVRQAVLLDAEEPLSTALRAGLGLTVPEAVARPVHPQALAWLLSFWTERLVGGPPPSHDDPTAIRAIATLSRSSLLKLLITCGREATGQGSTRELAGLGLDLIGRLLSRAEPFRVRWALQHLPYHLAKLIRSRIVSRVRDEVFDQDGLLFERSWDRFRLPRRDLA